MDAHHSYDLPNFKGYFVIEFSRSVTSFGTYTGDGKPAAKGQYLSVVKQADGTFTQAADGHDYCECSAQTSLWCVPHDALGVAALLGGAEVFEEQLDTYFRNLFSSRNAATARSTETSPRIIEVNLLRPANLSASRTT